MSRLLHNDKAIALFVFVIASSVYFATVAGITSSNDGSHYALVRAIVERHSFEIGPYLDFTEHQDYARRDGSVFSDRPPGTALLASPFYALGAIAPHPAANPPSKHDARNPRLLYAVLPAVLSASTTVSLFYLTLRHHLGRSRFSALLASLALAFGTTTWKYGSLLYSHAPAGLAIWLALYMILEIEGKQTLQHPFLLGVILGFAPLIEYTNILFSVMAGLYLVVTLWPALRIDLTKPDKRRFWIKQLLAFSAGGMLPIGFLLVYNTLNFGGPFEVSTFNVDTELWPQNAGLAADFATPLPEGLMGMLFYSPNGNQGIFLLSPITLLGLFGLARFYRQEHRRFILVIGVFIVYLLVFSKSTTFNPLTNDGRYITPFIGLWLVPFSFWIDECQPSHQSEVMRLAYSLLTFGLLFISARNQLLHIAFSWNHDFDPARLQPLAASPDNIMYLLRTVFPNVSNLPLLWAGMVLVAMVVWITRRWLRQRLAAA